MVPFLLISVQVNLKNFYGLEGGTTGLYTIQKGNGLKQKTFLEIDFRLLLSSISI